MLQAVPHEDPVVGAGLLLFGLALLATAPRFPALDLPGWALGASGVLLCCSLAAGMALFGARPDLPKGALFTVGLALAGLAPVAQRRLRWRAEPVPVSSLGVALTAALAAPLLAWAAQAAFKTRFGATPTEAFVAYGLVRPLVWLLALVGWHPVAHGQSLTYDALAGPLQLDVGAACSGIQAMAVFGGVLAIFLLTQRPPPGLLALWALIGLFGVYLVNLLRLLTLAVVGHYWGVAALLWVHADAGWVFFVAWALLFAWLSKRRLQPTPAPTPRLA